MVRPLQGGVALAVGKQADPKFPEVMLDLFRFTEACLVDQIGLSRNEARDAAKTIADQFWNEYAGFQVYIPVGRAIRVSERDRALVAAYRAGKPKDELLREYDISNATFYIILRRVDAVDAATQLDLFEANEEPDPSTR